MQKNVDRDARLQGSVISALAADPRVRVPELGVEVHDGVVVLTGMVSTWAARSDAEEIAHAVPGVKDVVDAVLVGDRREPAGFGDVAVARAVRAAMEAAYPARSDAIAVTVSDRVVTLEGFVALREIRDTIVRAVSAAPGVRRVQDWMVVRPPAREEESIVAQIAHALAMHAAHAAKHVAVSVDGDVVKLSGVVRSEAERDAVVGAVKGSARAHLIDSRELHVVP